MPYHETTVNGMSLRKVRKFLIRNRKRILATNNPDGIVCRGLSGASLGAIAAEVLGLPVMFVRKKNDESHGVAIQFGEFCNRLIFVDDFIDEGITFRACRDAMRESQKIVSVLLLDCYGEGSGSLTGLPVFSYSANK